MGQNRWVGARGELHLAQWAVAAAAGAAALISFPQLGQKRVPGALTLWQREQVTPVAWGRACWGACWGCACKGGRGCCICCW